MNHRIFSIITNIAFTFNTAKYINYIIQRGDEREAYRYKKAVG